MNAPLVLDGLGFLFTVLVLISILLQHMYWLSNRSSDRAVSRALVQKERVWRNCNIASTLIVLVFVVAVNVWVKHYA